MNILIERDALIEVLQRISNTVPQKPTLPVLSNYLLKATQGKVSVSGTDMDISMTTMVECSVEHEGAITVNARRFLGIIRELPAGEIQILTEDNQVVVNFSSGQSSLLGIPADDYPALRDTLDGVSLHVSGEDLALMVEKTGFSVSQDRTRLSLTGIYWKVSGDEEVMVSTDGHRLSFFSRKMEVDIGGDVEAIIPPKTLLQAAQIISAGGTLERVVFGDGAVLFDFGSTTIFSKLIEGPYPNFQQVIPQNNTKKVYVSTESFATAVRRVSVLSNAITHQIKLEVEPGKMELATKNDDIGGESRDTTEIRYDGEPITAAYNAHFLMEILKRIDSDEVLIELETPKTACLLRPVGEKETDRYLYLIMPLRLSE